MKRDFRNDFGERDQRILRDNVDEVTRSYVEGMVEQYSHDELVEFIVGMLSKSSTDGTLNAVHNIGGGLQYFIESYNDEAERTRG